MIPNRLLRIAPLALLIASSALVAACAGGGDDDDDVASTATPFCTPGTIGNTLSQLQTQVFNPNCAIGGTTCHAMGGQVPNLSAGQTHASVVNVPSTQQTQSGVTLDRIEPNNVNGSYLYLKIVGSTSITGTRMPQSSLPLCQEKFDKIEEWINNGALNN